MNKKVILASKSPRRLEILNKMGIDSLVIPASIEENLPDGIPPKNAVMFLSLKKALACEKLILELNEFQNPENYMIIASDTVVFKDQILGKPKDANDAFEMLSNIRNTWHYVATGVSIIIPSLPKRETFCDITDVHCINYSDEQICEYIASGEAFDKAGAYGIQGEFGKYIDKFSGDYYTVVGLPFEKTKAVLLKYDL